LSELSIIIVTYNPGNIFFDCLRSLPSGVGELTSEIIVVDNASQDGIVEQAAEQFPFVRFIKNTENRGFAGGNNQGLSQAVGKYLLLLNPDVVAEPESLKILVEFLEKNSDAGVVGPHTVDGEGKLSLTAYGSYNAGTILWKYLGINYVLPNLMYGRYRLLSQTATEPFEVAWLQASCLLTRRAVYEQIGGLDEGFFLFAEDPDFCDRATHAGWKTYFVPEAHIMHLESAVVSRYPERSIRNYHISPLHYFRKREQEGQVLLLKCGFTLELLLKMCIRAFQRIQGHTTVLAPRIYWRILGDVWQY